MPKRSSAHLRRMLVPGLGAIALCLCVVLAGCGEPGTSGSITQPPGLLLTTSSLPQGLVGTSYSTTLTAKNGTPPYAFSVSQGLIPPGFVMDSNGLLTGIPTTAGTYSFTALVTDATKLTATQGLTLIIAPPLAITTTTLSAAIINTAYSTQIQLANGTAPYSFTVTAGSLPQGLALSSSGLLSGTPTQLGTSSFTVTVADSGNQTASVAYTLAVVTPTLTLNSTSLPFALLNTAYSATLGITGGVTPYNVTTSGTLPAGLNVSSAGIISGTPTAEGAYSFNVSITDTEAQPQSINTTLTISVGTAAQVSVNATKVLATVPANAYGLHTAVYDPQLTVDATTMAPLLAVAGVQTLRYPGGNYSDTYHWSEIASTPEYGSPSSPACNVLPNEYMAPTTDFGNFAKMLQTVGAQALITVNYGTSVANAAGTLSLDQTGKYSCSEPNTWGQPQEAAAWVAYANGDPSSTQTIGLDGVGYNWKTVGFWASLRAASPLPTDDGYNFLRINHPTAIGVKNWEVGNEVYYNGWNDNLNPEEDLHAPYIYPNGYAGGTFNSRANVPALGPTAYGTNAVAWIQAMKAVDPTIKIGVDLSSPIVDPISLSWNPDVMQAVCASANFDIAIIHYYPGTYQDVQSSEMLSDPQVDLPQLIATMKQQLPTYCPANANNVQFFITETSPNGTLDPSVTQPVIGLFAMDIMLSGLSAGYSNIDWLALHNGTFLTAAEQPGPAFYGIQMAHSALGGGDSAVASTSSTSSVVAFAGVKTNGQKSLVLLNSDPNGPAQVTVSFTGATLGSTATQFSFGASTTQNSPTLTGTSVPIAGNTFVQVVPAYTAVELLIP